MKTEFSGFCVIRTVIPKKTVADAMLYWWNTCAQCCKFNKLPTQVKDLKNKNKEVKDCVCRDNSSAVKST